MSPDDLPHLRRAFAVARRAREHGNAPFGTVLVDEHDAVLLEAENTLRTSGDCTGHAEMNLVREVGRRFSPDVLGRCSLYSSTEPCAMCAGAVFWCGIGRVVFGLSLPRLFALAANVFDPLLLRCGEVFASGRRRVDVVGPLLEDEAAAVFNGYFAIQAIGPNTGEPGA